MTPYERRPTGAASAVDEDSARFNGHRLMTATTQTNLAAEIVGLDVARALVRAGVPVFVAHPARDTFGRWDPNGGSGGTGYQLPAGWERTTPDEAVIDAWVPGDALGAVTGHTVDGVDVDPRHGGDLTVTALSGAGVWPRTYGRQATPSGGWHDLVAPLRVRSRDAVDDGIDVKAGMPDGTGRGFLFIAPTMRLSKATGEITGYRWTTTPDLARLDDTDHTGRALAARINALRAPVGDSGPDLPHAAHDAMSDPQRAAVGRYLAAVVHDTTNELALTATWAEGHRDDQQRGWQKVTADVCNRFGRLSRADWNAWTYAEAYTQLAAVVPAPMATAVGLDSTWVAQRDRRPPAPWPGILDDSLTLLRPRADAAAAVHDQDDDTEDPKERARRVFPRLDWHALWADDTVEEWIHEPLVPARRSVVIYSPPKVGKSLLMLELAVAVSRGAEFLGHRPQARFRVLYVDFENDPRGDVRTRLQAMGLVPDDLDHLDYLSYPTMAGLDTERGSLELLEAVAAYGSDVVVIDTISRAVDGEENSNDTWLALYRKTGLKLKQAGVALVRLDHTGKDESKGQRGGSAKSGDVDAIWKLTKIGDDQLRLECMESRLQIAVKSLVLHREHLPKLHHALVALDGATAYERRVASLVELLAANQIPLDANRKVVRDFAHDRGVGASGSVVQEAIRARKGELVHQFTPPESTPEPWPSSAISAEPPNARSEHEIAELSPRVHQSSTRTREPELSGAVRSTPETVHPFTCHSCGEPNEDLRAAAGLDCLACHGRAAS